MEVNIYGRNIKVTERLEEYVSEKVQKFAQLGDNVKDIDVKFSKDGHLGGESIRVEITVVGTGPVLRSEARSRQVRGLRMNLRQAPGASAPCT